jgi:hypothetical protein
MIAHSLTTVLFPLADVVIDIHTGGRRMDFFPCTAVRIDVAVLVKMPKLTPSAPCSNTRYAVAKLRFFLASPRPGG